MLFPLAQLLCSGSILLLSFLTLKCRAMKSFLLSLLELLEVALVTVGAVIIVRTFLVQPFLVHGASMVPTFMHGDYLLVDELSYRFRAPERGEVIVFSADFGTEEGSSRFLIKRVIGLPGERVVLENGRVLIYNSTHPEGFMLHEGYIPSGVLTMVRPGGIGDVTLGPNEYFVLGDNRSASYDSREWGVLRSQDIVGLTRFRLWPPATLAAFAAPQY